jgi:hypothetical protein
MDWNNEDKNEDKMKAIRAQIQAQIRARSSAAAQQRLVTIRYGRCTMQGKRTIIARSLQYIPPPSHYLRYFFSQRQPIE